MVPQNGHSKQQDQYSEMPVPSLKACKSMEKEHPRVVRDPDKNLEKQQSGVLLYTGIELSFFLVASTVLCFGFSMRIMLMTH